MNHVERERNPFSVRRRLVSSVILIPMRAEKQGVSVDFCALPQMFSRMLVVVRSGASWSNAVTDPTNPVMHLVATVEDSAQRNELRPLGVEKVPNSRR